MAMWPLLQINKQLADRQAKLVASVAKVNLVQITNEMDSLKVRGDQIMPRRQPSSRIPYVGFDSLGEELLPNASETELRVIELETEVTTLRQEITHLRCAMKAAATVLAPYSNRLNGGTQ